MHFIVANSKRLNSENHELIRSRAPPHVRLYIALRTTSSKIVGKIIWYGNDGNVQRRFNAILALRMFTSVD